MTTEDEPEFTHQQGLAIGGLALLVGVGLMFFGERWAELGTIAFAAVAVTVFIQRRLLRRPWFLAFVALMVIAQLSLVLAFPWADLDRSEFKIFALADMLVVLGLSFALEKLVTILK